MIFNSTFDIIEFACTRLRCIYHAVSVVEHRVCVVSIAKVLSPHIVVSACAAIEQIGYFSACKFIGCSRNTISDLTTAVCQIVAVGLGALITANAADKARSRNRSCIVAGGDRQLSSSLRV